MYDSTPEERWVGRALTPSPFPIKEWGRETEKSSRAGCPIPLTPFPEMERGNRRAERYFSDQASCRVRSLETAQRSFLRDELFSLIKTPPTC
jgi:hypothetical protein